MARYANHECAGCGKILPAYELAEVSDRVETGLSRHERRIGISADYRRTGLTRHYANRVKRLCMRCRVNRFVGKVVMLGGGGLLFLAFASQPDDTNNSGAVAAPSTAKGLLNGAASLIDQAGDAVTSATSVTHAVTDHPDVDAERGDAQPPTPSEGSAPNERADLTQQVLTAPESVEQVEQAVQRAVERGKAIRWKVHKLRGYAVPSEPASNGCRMIQVSIDHGEQGAPFQRCPAAGEGQEL